MAELGHYRTMGEFTDEDKWFRYFTKWQLAVVIALIAADYQIIMFFYKLGLAIAGILAVATVSLLSLAVTMLRMPDEKYIFGGGSSLSALFARIVRRKAVRSNRIVAVRHDSRREEDA